MDQAEEEKVFQERLDAEEKIEPRDWMKVTGSPVRRHFIGRPYF